MEAVACRTLERWGVGAGHGCNDPGVCRVDPLSPRIEDQGVGTENYPKKFYRRKFELTTYDSVDFSYLSANTHPDYDTIATFR